jgi:hypothetical protein
MKGEGSRGLLHQRLNLLLLISKKLKKLHLWLIVLASERQWPGLFCTLMVVEDLIQRVRQLMVLIDA